MHVWRISREKRRKNSTHGQKDLIKTSLLYIFIKEISSSNEQRRATKKENTCEENRRRKVKENYFRRHPADRMQPATDSAGSDLKPPSDRMELKPIGWLVTAVTKMHLWVYLLPIIICG